MQFQRIQETTSGCENVEGMLRLEWSATAGTKFSKPGVQWRLLLIGCRFSIAEGGKPLIVFTGFLLISTVATTYNLSSLNAQSRHSPVESGPFCCYSESPSWGLLQARRRRRVRCPPRPRQARPRPPRTRRTGKEKKEPTCCAASAATRLRRPPTEWSPPTLPRRRARKPDLKSRHDRPTM